MTRREERRNCRLQIEDCRSTLVPKVVGVYFCNLQSKICNLESAISAPDG